MNLNSRLTGKFAIVFASIHSLLHLIAFHSIIFSNFLKFDISIDNNNIICKVVLGFIMEKTPLLVLVLWFYIVVLVITITDTVLYIMCSMN